MSGELAILKKRKFLNSTISIRICIVGIANLFQVCEYKKIDELNIENHIEIDRSEAEKYELIRESCVFSLLFFQPNSSCSGECYNKVDIRTMYTYCYNSGYSVTMQAVRIYHTVLWDLPTVNHSRSRNNIEVFGLSKPEGVLLRTFSFTNS